MLHKQSMFFYLIYNIIDYKNKLSAIRGLANRQIKKNKKTASQKITLQKTDY